MDNSPPNNADHERFPWPLADEAVLTALERIYRDGSWGKYHGPNCQELIAALREYHGVPHVWLTCSGTLAVELALRGVGVASGDEVVLAAYDFPGNFRAIEAIGARPVLVDIDCRTWCLDAEQLAMVDGNRVRAVIASHLHGGLADMQRIGALAKDRGWAVVEDACQSPGAIVAGRRAGTWGDVGVLSFGGSKLLTAGRGGALIAANEQVLQRVKVFSERGNTAFPLSELQAAVLLPQLEKLDERNAQRFQSVSRLLNDVAGLVEQIRPGENFVEGLPAYYKVPWLWQGSHAARETLIQAMQVQGVPLDAGFRGFAGRTARRCRKVGRLDSSRCAAEQTVLLHHPVLLATPRELDDVSAAMARSVRQMRGIK